MCNPASQNTAFGYPVVSPEQLGDGVVSYFKANPQVAGMAWGGGENGTDPNSPRSLVANPNNPYMADPQKRQGLLKLEAARHLMAQSGQVPQFAISPEQQEWRKGLGAYATNDNAFKQSIVSRLIANDAVPGMTQDQQVAADRLNHDLEQRSRPSLLQMLFR